MSPEQGTDRPIDRRSDMFSLGIVLFELTTGKRLFRGRNEAETLAARDFGGDPEAERDRRRLSEAAGAYRAESARARPDPPLPERGRAPARPRGPARAIAGPGARPGPGLLVEQVFGERIHQRRAELERAERGSRRRRARIAVQRSGSSPVELLPESSRTPLNSSSEIVAPARGALGYAMAARRSDAGAGCGALARAARVPDRDGRDVRSGFGPGHLPEAGDSAGTLAHGAKPAASGSRIRPRFLYRSGRSGATACERPAGLSGRGHRSTGRRESPRATLSRPSSRALARLGVWL